MRERLAFLTLCLGSLMVILDGTAVAVALPTIQHQLGFGQSGLAWVVNAYLISFGGLLLLFGRLGDLLGRGTVFLAGMAVFTGASLACGLATDQAVLVTARFVQGVGAAAVSAVSLGMLVMLFPRPRERATAIGAFSFIGAGGASLGIVAGGVLTQLLSWHWIFVVNVPIGGLAIALGARVLPRERGTGPRAGADVLGAVLGTGALVAGVYGIVRTTNYGWGSARTLDTLAVAVALLAGFVLRQTRAAMPLLPLRILRSRSVVGGNAVQLLMIAAAMGGFQFLVTLYLQKALGFSALRTGIASLPTPLVIGAVSLGISARVVAQFGARTVALAGLVFVGMGLALLTGIPVHGGYLFPVLPAAVVFGIGGGFALPAVTGLAMTGVPAADAGVASGLANTTQQIGAALGTAGLAAAATSRADVLHAAGQPMAAALTGGYQLGFEVATAVVALALVVAITVLPRRAADQAPAPSLTSVGSA